MKKLTYCFMVLALVCAMTSMAAADSYTFSAAQVKSVMQSYGAPLSNDAYLWGLWAVRTMPIVTGDYTITGGSTTQTGWEVSAPSTYDFGEGPVPYSWPSPYGSNCAWFADTSGAEVEGNPPNPLYVIIDQPASRFTSYYENTVTAVSDASTFTVNFTLDSGATWNGAYQFVVDGSKYNAGVNPATWNENFFGGMGDVGGLAFNTGAGYQVPLPGTLLLLGSGLAGLAIYRKHRGAAKS